MYEKQTLEFPMAKYFTHPRRIGLILSITPLIGWDMEFRKMSLSLSSSAVRFLPFGNKSGIHRPSPATPDTTELKAKKSKTLPSL
jgi:hypothetical protein